MHSTITGLYYGILEKTRVVGSSRRGKRGREGPSRFKYKRFPNPRHKIKLILKHMAGCSND